MSPVSNSSRSLSPTRSTTAWKLMLPPRRAGCRESRASSLARRFACAWALRVSAARSATSASRRSRHGARWPAPRRPAPQAAPAGARSASSKRPDAAVDIGVEVAEQLLAGDQRRDQARALVARRGAIGPVAQGRRSASGALPRATGVTACKSACSVFAAPHARAASSKPARHVEHEQDAPRRRGARAAASTRNSQQASRRCAARSCAAPMSSRRSSRGTAQRAWFVFTCSSASTSALDADRLGDVVVHARGQARLAVALHRVGGHRDDARAAAVAASAR